MIAEIIGPSGRVHYRRPVDDPLVEEARKTPGYSVRFVKIETVEHPISHEVEDVRDSFTNEMDAFWDQELGRYGDE